MAFCCANGGADMDTIRELYYSNVHSFERDIEKDSESDRLAKLVFRHDAALKATMNENELELFGKFKDAVTELNCLNECESFVNGFRLGVRLIVEALHTEEYSITQLPKQGLQLFVGQTVFHHLFRRISPCVRFVGKSRVSTRLRAFSRCRRFLSASQFLRRLIKEYTIDRVVSGNVKHFGFH